MNKIKLYPLPLILTFLFQPLGYCNQPKNSDGATKVVPNSLQLALLREIENGSATQVSICLWQGASPNARTNVDKETPLMFAIHQLAKEAKNEYPFKKRLKDIGTFSLYLAGSLTGALIGGLMILKSNLADQMSHSEKALAYSGFGMIVLSLAAGGVKGYPFLDRATYSQALMIYKRVTIIKKLLNHEKIDISLTNENDQKAIDIVRSYIADNPNCAHLIKTMKQVALLLLEKTL
jgi:hypothetical protein